MKWIFKRIENLYNKKIDSTGLAIFRILYSIVLLCEIVQLYYFRHLIYDKIPFIEPSDVDFSIGLIIWMVVVSFLILGLFTRQAAIINYIISLIFIATLSSYEYHMFYVYMGVNFLLIFVNVSQTISLDRLRLKLKYSNTRFQYVPTRDVSVLNYYILVLLAIAFVYFDSVFYKLFSHNWMSGIGMWLPASLPQVVHTNASFLLNSKWISLSLGYITLAFEAIFIFVFWRKKWRWPLFIVGVGLHLGIVIQFPIPWFGLGVCALYMLLVPVYFWKCLCAKLKFRSPKLQFYYDEECPLCIRTKIIINHLDFTGAIEFKGVQTYAFESPVFSSYSKNELLNNVFSVTLKGKILQGVDTYIYTFKRIPVLFPLGIIMSIPGFYSLASWIYRLVAKNRETVRCTEDNCGYIPPIVPLDIDSIRILKNVTVKDFRLVAITLGILLLMLLQFNVTYDSYAVRKVRSISGISKTFPDKLIKIAFVPIHKYSKIFFGITKHRVFMDEHFAGYNHIIAVEAEDESGKKYWLPIIDRNGMAGSYIYSFNWVKWTFRVDGQNIDQDRLKSGVRDFTAFWAVKNGYSVDKLKFNIYVKNVEVPLEWKYDHLNSMLNRRWILVGKMYWEGDEFISTVPNIEDIKL